MKKMTLDEAILYYYYDKDLVSNMFSKYRKLYWPAAIILLLSLFSWVVPNSQIGYFFCFIAALLGGSAYFVNIGKMIYYSNKETKFYHFLFKESLKLPYQKEHLAKDLYGNIEGTLAAIECEESHYPGDCPLCGAN